MTAWWDEHKGRLEWEVAQLEAAGLAPVVDYAAQGRGVVAIDLTYPHNGVHIKLRALFPDFYPYFRPEVFAPELDLDRHQTPFGKNLCMLGRSNPDWLPDYSLADLIVEQMPKILDINDGMASEDIKKLEEPQGEPFSDYLSYLPNSTLSIDTSWKVPADIDCGTMDIATQINMDGPDRPIIRGVVKCICNAAGEVLASWDNAVLGEYNVDIEGVPWKRSALPTDSVNPVEFIEAFHAKDDQGKPGPAVKRKHTTPKLAVEICAILFEEEVLQMEHSDGWLVAAKFLKMKNATRVKSTAEAFVRVQRAGQADLNSRVPARSAFCGKVIVVVGAGAIGAPLILDLARNGASKIHVLEHDIVEPGNTIRWPLGTCAYGINKGHALKSFIAANYPDTHLEAHPVKVGNIRDCDSGAELEGNQPELLDMLLDGADLVIDATAEVGVHRLMSNLCVVKKKPLICPSATPGAWGGIVVRCLPDAGNGCWYCFEHHVDDDQKRNPNERIIPTPSTDNDNGIIQPPGCADRTFLGAGYDVMEVVLETMRVAADTLSADQGDDPKTDWGVSVVSLKNADGRMVPKWETADLHQHESCPVCKGNK